jgi:hypothetical protein
MGVAELNKPPNVWCAHLKLGRGCGIYETRPDTCRGFFCRWMEDPGLGPEWKPNRSKLVLAHIAEHQLAVYVDPGAPGAWRKEPYLSQLVAMAKTGLKHNAILKIIEQGRVFVLLPNRVAELGAVGPEDTIVLKKMPAPGGHIYDVSVERDEK